MDLCMKHRFEDEHDCKPVKDDVQYEKVKQNMKFFNWGQDIKKDKAKAKQKNKDEKMTFGEKMVRFFVCCGPKDKPPKDSKQKKGNLPNKGQTKYNQQASGVSL